MLTHKDKKYIKRNIHNKKICQLAADLHIEENIILQYLQNIWSEEKYKKYIGRHITEKQEQFSILSIQFHLIKWLKINYNWAYLLSLLLLVGIAYANSLNNAFISDDIFGIVDRRAEIGQTKYLFSNSYRFIQPLLYFISFKINGLNPIFFRMWNVLFHAGNVVLIFILVGLFARPIVAFFTAAIFAVHPILVESVSWISGGPYNIYSFFFLLSLILYILSSRNKLLYISSIISYVLAMLIGLPAITLSPIFFLIEFLFGDIRKRWYRVVPFLALSAFLIVQPLLDIQHRSQTFQTQHYQNEAYYNPFLQIPISITSYIQLIFWPDKLTLYHSELTFTVFEYLMRLILFLGMIGMALYFYKKNKLIFTHISIFFFSLAPTLTPVAIAWVVAERYVYLGTYAIIFIFAYYFARFAESKKYETIAYIILVVIIISLTSRTIARNIDWKNEDNMWIATSKTSPSDPKTHNNLGDVYTRAGNYQKAIEEFGIAIQLNSRYADAYNNLGNVYYKMGDIDNAFKSYQKALEINPNIWQTHQNIAIIYAIQKDYNNAIESMQKSILISPSNPSLYVNMGFVYLELKNKLEAQKAFSKALELEPTNPQAKEGLASAQK